jgi:hypothetical protein
MSQTLTPRPSSRNGCLVDFATALIEMSVRTMLARIGHAEAAHTANWVLVNTSKTAWDKPQEVPQDESREAW